MLFNTLINKYLCHPVQQLRKKDNIKSNETHDDYCTMEENNVKDLIVDRIETEGDMKTFYDAVKIWVLADDMERTSQEKMKGLRCIKQMVESTIIKTMIEEEHPYIMIKNGKLLLNEKMMYKPHL